MDSNDQQALDSLTHLVKHVFKHRDGLISSITYSELAVRIGRLNYHGDAHAHGMGNVLGKMGHLLQGLEGKWGESIPHIQSLVVQKTGPNKGLPDDGIKEFWPDYPKMSRNERDSRTRIEYQRIINFGSRWNDVLWSLDLDEIQDKNTLNRTERPTGSGGESEKHKALKKYVRENPSIVGADSSWEDYEEFPLRSLDTVDVFFRSAENCIAVEVKSSVSDKYPLDYERGLYQTIKYAALLEAMALSQEHKIPSSIKSILLLETELPYEYKKLAKALNVTVIEKIKPPV